MESWRLLPVKQAQKVASIHACASHRISVVTDVHVELYFGNFPNVCHLAKTVHKSKTLESLRKVNVRLPDVFFKLNGALFLRETKLAIIHKQLKEVIYLFESLCLLIRSAVSFRNTLT